MWLRKSSDLCPLRRSSNLSSISRYLMIMKLMPAASSIDHELLRLLALDAGFRDYVLLDKICADLKDGAVIGCKPEFR